LSGRLRAAALSAAVLAVLMAVAAGCGSGDNGNFNLKIGVLTPLTGSHDVLGRTGDQATKLAQAQVDAAIRKTGASQSVERLLQDEGPDGSVALRAAERLKAKHASCVVGPWTTSDVLLTMNQVFVPADTPIVSPAASGDTISGLHDADLVNRTVLPDRDQGPSLAQLMERQLKGGAKGKRAAVAAFDSIYGRNLLRSFLPAWRKLGGKVVARFTYKDKSDYTKEVKQLTRHKADAFVVFDTFGTFARMLPQLQAIKNWKAKKTWSADGLADPNLTTNTSLFGLRGVAPGSPDKTSAGAAFNRLWRKATKAPTDRQTYDAQAFDAYILCYLAAVAAGTSNGGKLADRLRKVSAPPGKTYTWMQLPQAVAALQRGEDIDYEGASGPIDLDGRGDPTAGIFDAYRISKERVDIQGDIAYPPPL